MNWTEQMAAALRNNDVVARDNLRDQLNEASYEVMCERMSPNAPDFDEAREAWEGMLIDAAIDLANKEPGNE